MRIKKRYIIFAIFILVILFGTIITYTLPALPVIQLPGECYPGTSGLPVFNCVTNTFVAALVAWIVVVAVALSLRARSRTVDEVPTGFYNLFEAVIEGGLNYATNIAGTRRAKDFFPLFVTIILYVLVANWMELVPPIDSLGLTEYLPHLEAEKAAKAMEDEAKAEGLVAFESEEAREEFIHDIEHDIDEENIGNYLDSFIILRAPENVDNCIFDEGACAPDKADYAIVPFLRAAATDLNFTLALALVTMFMVQYYGFKYLGFGYLRKFFAFDIDAIAKNPIRVLDPAVGILELIGEFARIISFSFRLLGNIFAGQILLFVMAFLIPIANAAVYGLELFVGLIQAAVFGLLALMFMNGATESHGDHDEHH